MQKTIKELKCNESMIRVKKLDQTTLRLVVFSDASLGNLEGGSSQLGYIIFLVDATGSGAPISWASKKSKRVARSTLTAETLAASEAIDCAMVIKSTVEEMLRFTLPPILLLVDSKSLHDAVRTTNTISEKRLMQEMSALRQMAERKEIELKWISTKDQLANVLTKDGADKRPLIQVMKSGKVPLLLN